MTIISKSVEASEHGLIGSLLRGYHAGHNDIHGVRRLLPDAATFTTPVARALYQAFLDHNIPSGKKVSTYSWSSSADVNPEVAAQMYLQVPTSGQVMEFAKQVALAGVARDLSREGRRLSALAGGWDDVVETLNDSRAKLEDLAATAFEIEGGGCELSTAERYKLYREKLADKTSKPPIRSHIPALNDALNGGVRGGQLVVIAGRPGMGKSALAMGWAEHASMMGGVLVYSLEMSASEFFERFDLRFKEDQAKAMLYWRGRDIEIIDTLSDTTIEGILADAYRRAALLEARGKSLDMIVIDHLGLIAPSAHLKNRTRENEVAHITRESKKFAKLSDSATVLLSQLNRNLEHRDDKAPRMADLRDSGSIEQDADIVLGLFRPIYYEATATGVPDQIRALKVRQASPRLVSARFVPGECAWKSWINPPTPFNPK